MRPPGCSGKAKRGHLCFDAAFETGNLGKIDFVAEYDYDLYIRPDTSNPRYRLWFNFTVDNVKANQTAIFNLINIHKGRNLFCEGLTPLVRSTSRPKWTRMPSENVYYYESAEHNGQNVLSFAICFDVEMDVYQFALTYPYSYTRLQTFLDVQDEKNYGFWWRHLLAKTVLKRDCEVVTITSPKNYRGHVQEAAESLALLVTNNEETSPASNSLQATEDKGPDGNGEDENEEDDDVDGDDDDDDDDDDDEETTAKPKKKGPPRVVVILARVHAGESPTSYMVQGMMEFLTGNSTEATTLRDHVVFKIIPMLNPDGTYLGNYRSTLMGWDLNRSWNEATVWGHPTIYAAKELILQLDEAPWCELDLVLDLHAHSSLLGTFIYGNSYDDVYRHERHIVFPKMMSYACEDYCHDNTIYNKDPAKSQTARRWLCQNLKDSSNVYSIHTSIYGYKNSRGVIIPYSEESYIRTGKNIVMAVLDYYQFLGLIPHSIPTALPLHDLPRRRGPSPPPLSRHAARHLQQAIRQTPPAVKSKWISGARIKMAPSEPQNAKELEGIEVGITDTGASASSEDESSISSGSGGMSDNSGLLVRIKQKAASADEDEVGYMRRYGSDRETRAVRLPAVRSRNVADFRVLGDQTRRRSARRTRQPKTNYVTLFPDQEELYHPLASDDDTRSLPDLPSLKTSLPVLRTNQGKKRKSYPFVPSESLRPTTLVWEDIQRDPLSLAHKDIKLSYRYYDFRRLTKPRKKRHRRKVKSRSPSRSRAPVHHNKYGGHSVHSKQNHSSQKKGSHSNPGKYKGKNKRKRGKPRPPAAAPSSPEDGQPRRMVAGGGFNAKLMPTPPRDGVGRNPTQSRGVKMIDVNQLTIGGYREHANVPRWQAAPRRPPIAPPHLPTSPPLLRRFLDPKAPLF
ncbi:cytosolic carboxypeptidase-like protein 5 isoform X1 [Macrobrachium rosenbergii]|uniref:cytosolic carboxypeptidase-like protein 5 isoform X1 n=2 Tax=Macrobrachium rosenbergii TaxID=79674 RepID=UPI0034D61CCC